MKTFEQRRDELRKNRQREKQKEALKRKKWIEERRASLLLAADMGESEKASSIIRELLGAGIDFPEMRSIMEYWRKNREREIRC